MILNRGIPISVLVLTKVRFMPQAILARDKLAKGCLPEFCMRCGAPAFVNKRKVFRWMPATAPSVPFVGSLVFLWGVANSDIIEAYLPLCFKHRNHFLFRNSLTKVILGFVLFAFFLALGASRYDLALGFGMAFIVPLLILIAAGPGIRAMAITGESIILSGVSGAFLKKLVTDGYSSPISSAQEKEQAGEMGLDLPKYSDFQAMYRRRDPQSRN